MKTQKPGLTGATLLSTKWKIVCWKYGTQERYYRGRLIRRQWNGLQWCMWEVK